MAEECEAEEAEEAEEGEDLEGRVEEECDGVAVIVHNGEDYDDLEFYLETKGDGYPVGAYRNTLGFLGGEIEDDEDAMEALEREVYAEVKGKAGKIIMENVTGKYALVKVTPPSGDSFTILVYESVIEDEDDWETVTSHKENTDGGPNVTVRAEELCEHSYAWGADHILEDFLEDIGEDDDLKGPSYGKIEIVETYDFAFMPKSKPKQENILQSPLLSPKKSNLETKIDYSPVLRYAA